jgi:hypothetical protein
MAGTYCRYCGHRCFVDRTLPDFSWSGHLATCLDGMAHDRKVTGYDHTTALNLIAPVPPGLRLQQVGDTGLWRVVHAASRKHVPLVDWPADEVPHRYAEIAAASLAASGVDWTLPQADLVDDLSRVAEAVRTASTVAYDGAVRAGDRTDDRPPRATSRTAAPPGAAVSPSPGRCHDDYHSGAPGAKCRNGR